MQLGDAIGDGCAGKCAQKRGLRSSRYMNCTFGYTWGREDLALLRYSKVSSTPVAEVEGEAKVTGSKTRASSVPASSTPGATPTRRMLNNLRYFTPWSLEDKHARRKSNLCMLRPAEQPEAIEVSPEKVEDPKGALGESLPFMLPKARTDGNGEEQAGLLTVRNIVKPQPVQLVTLSFEV
eukprot:5804652-Amphidinium_carterae.2